MDAQFTKVNAVDHLLARIIADHFPQIDRVDPHYYAHTSRIDIKDETRINATSEEASQWENAQRLSAG